MKLNPLYHGGLILVLATGPLAAQDDSALSALKETLTLEGETRLNATGSGNASIRKVIGKSKTRSLVDALREYEKELADLDEATSRRRAELIRKLAETRAEREAQSVAEADLETLKQAGQFALLHRVDQSPPEWVIGVVIEEGEQGVRVNKVMDGKPGAAAGLKDGDVLKSCNAIALRDRSALVNIIQAAQDQELVLSVQRGGEGAEVATIDIKVTPVRNEQPKTDSEERQVEKALQRGFRYLENSGSGKILVDPYVNGFSAEPSPSLRFTSYPKELRDDNNEVKDLLRQLITEVKKLQK